MDNLIYYKILKLIDNNNISKQYNLNIYNTTINDLIQINNLNIEINNFNEIKKNKYYFSKYIIKEYNRVFLSTSNKVLQSRLSIKNLIKYYPIFYQLKQINKEITEKFYKNGRDKILQSRLSIKDIVKKSEYSLEPYLLKYYFRDIDYLCSKNIIRLFN